MIIVAAALVVGGCGAGGEGSESAATKGAVAAPASGRAVMEDAARELAKVRSYHIAGHVEDADGTSTDLTGDLLPNGSGHIVLTVGESRAEMILLKGDAYLKGNTAFWNETTDNEVPYDVIKRLVGRWVVQDAPDGGITSVLEKMGPKHMSACLLSGSGTLTQKGTGTVNGQAVTIVEDAGDVAGGASGRFYIRRNAPHRLLRAEQTGPIQPGTAPSDPGCDEGDDDETDSMVDIRFSRFDDVKPLRAPRGALRVQQAFRGGGAA
ncbi:hypothetical protein [Baekduia sp. Peel2402]|uniref:hypothetical protein n=1 Tax=Baekduia sp. Peel2402 TaxID=3458296 RepID=UPI00403EBEEE